MPVYPPLRSGPALISVLFALSQEMPQPDTNDGMNATKHPTANATSSRAETNQLHPTLEPKVPWKFQQCLHDDDDVSLFHYLSLRHYFLLCE